MTADDRLRRTQLDYHRIRSASLTPAGRLEYWKDLLNRNEATRAEVLNALDFPDLDLAKADDFASDRIMEEFVAGDDTAQPSAFMDLARSREVAATRAHRYLRWVKMIDELTAERHSED